MRRKVGGIGGNSGRVRGPSLAPPRGQNRLRPRGCGGGGDNDFIIISVIIEERERGRINMVGPSVPPSVVRRPQKKSFAHFERERGEMMMKGNLLILPSSQFTPSIGCWTVGRLGTSLASRNLSRSLGSFIAHHLISVHAVAFLFAITPSPICSHSPFSFCDAKLSSLDRTQVARRSHTNQPFTARLPSPCTVYISLELCPQTVVERASEQCSDSTT